MDRRKPYWTDRLGVRGTFAATAALHFAAAHFSNEFLVREDGVIVLCLATGVSIGIAHIARTKAIRRAALAGGVFAEVLFLATADQLHPAWALLLSHIIEGPVVFATLTYAVASRTSVGPSRAQAHAGALLHGLIASFLGSLPVVLPDWSTQFALEWTVAHGLGMMAAGSVFALGSHAALHRANFSNRRWELLGLVLALVAVIVITVWVEQAFTIVIVGLCLILASRFGLRFGQPVSVLAVTAVVAAGAGGLGQLTSGRPSQLIGLWVFAATIVLVASAVGHLAATADRQNVEKRHSANRWQKLASTGFDGFVQIDRNYEVCDASETIAQFYGQSLDELRGRSYQDIVTKDTWEKTKPLVPAVLDGQSARVDQRFTLKDGRTRWILAVVQPELDSAGKFESCTIYLLDTTEIHRQDAERANSREALVKAKELERLRLAQVVHDGALQDLSAANLLVGSALLREQSGQQPLGDRQVELARIESLLVSGMRKLRTDAIGTMPIDLTDLDVEEALERTVEKFTSANSQVRVRIDTVDVRDATPDMSKLIFRVAQEALINALLHSKATEVSVDIRPRQNGFAVAIRDNGIGFDTNRLQKAAHLGLSAMTALASEAGGWCSLSTREGAGTTVDAWVPVHSDHTLRVPTFHLSSAKASSR